MINVKNLSVSYGEKIILENANLQIEENKITCIVGESGVGKTTLLNAISGLKEYTGKIENLPNKIAYVFQTPRLIPFLTVEENLKLINQNEGEILEILTELEIQNLYKNLAKNLSGGEAQRVSLARAFLYNAPLILLDEPFSFLDMGLRRKMTLFLQKLLKNSNKTLIFVTHDESETLTFSDNLAVIKNKKIQLIKDFKLLEDKSKTLYSLLEI